VANEADLFVRVQGDPKAPLRLICVHGAMDRAHSFFALGNLLSPFMEVVSYDRRGYAHSWQEQAPSIEDHLVDLRQLASEKPCMVFGHSFGGYLALKLASERLPFLGAVGVFEAPLPESFRFPFSDIDPASAARGEIPDELARRHAEGFLSQMVGRDVWMRLGSRTQEARRKEGRTFVREVAELALTEPPLVFEKIDVPVTVGVSQFGIGRHLQGGQELLERLSWASGYCVLGASHGAHLSNPRALFEVLLALSREVAT